MKILAIETSTMLGGVALMAEPEGLISEVRINVKTAHSERLMTGIEYALQQGGMSISDIDVFGISIGPGSFTGLRIGVSTVKGLSYATGKPVVSVPTLEALAWNFPFSPHAVCTMFDARRKEVYAAVFRWRDGGFEKVMHERSLHPSELLKELNGTVIFAGEGAMLYRELIREGYGDDAIFPAPQFRVPSPSCVAYLGLKKAMQGDFSEPMGLVPFYIRKSEAEIKMDAGNRQ